MATNIEVPDALDDSIEETYEARGYASKSEFVRDAIRQQLRELGEIDG